MGRQQHDLRPALKTKLGADQQFQLVFSGGDMRTYYTGEGALIGDRQRRVTKRCRARDQLLRMRSAAQKAEIADAMQLGIVGKNSGHHESLWKFRAGDSNRQRRAVLWFRVS